MNPSSSDPNPVEPLQDKLMSDQSIALMGHLIYIGHKLNLFHHLAEHGPLTAEALAELATCYQRFVREWLQAMVHAGWLTYDPELDHFTLPAEYTFFLDVKMKDIFRGQV